MDKQVKSGSSEPQVGIVYLVGDDLYIDSTPVATAGDYGDFTIHERSHIDRLLAGAGRGKACPFS